MNDPVLVDRRLLTVALMLQCCVRLSVKVMLTIPAHSLLDIWETIRDRGFSKGPPIGNRLRRIEWSRDRRRHMTQKAETRDLNMLKV